MQQEWERVLFILKKLKTLSADGNAAFRAKKLELLEEGLDLVLEPVKKWPETSKACCEQLVHKLKVTCVFPPLAGAVPV